MDKINPNLDDDEYYGFDYFFSGCYLVEVIGNIYENTELLKGGEE